MLSENGDKKSRAIAMVLEVILSCLITLLSWHLLFGAVNSFLPQFMSPAVEVTVGTVIFFVEIPLGPSIGYLLCGPAAKWILQRLGKA